MESKGAVLSEVLIRVYKETFPCTSVHSPGTVPVGPPLTSTLIWFYIEAFYWYNIRQGRARIPPS